MALPNAEGFPGLSGFPEFNWEPVDQTKPEEIAIARKAHAVYAKQFEVVSQSRKAAGELISAVSKFTDCLGYVLAFKMTDRKSLYPFPGPGTLADVNILELRAALVAAQKTIEFLNTPIDIDEVGPVSPIVALRLIA